MKKLYRYIIKVNPDNPNRIQFVMDSVKRAKNKKKLKAWLKKRYGEIEIIAIRKNKKLTIWE